MIKLLLAILLAATSVSADPVQGRIDQTTDLRIVHVWGTPAEMGYAHGWLVGDDFVLGMKELFAGLPPAMHGLLNMVRSWTVWIALSDAHRAELDGIYRGMRDRLGEDAMQLPGVERPLDQTDLLLWNGYDMFRSVGCSGFTAWGDRTTDGETITARTLDLAVFSPHWVRTQILLVRHPNTGVATASVTPVCLLGTMTGINANGVCAFLHDGDGDEMTAVTESERPLMLALLDILQQATGSTAQQVAARELAAQGPFPYSYFIRIVGPQIGDAPPATTYRLDANGVSKATGGEQFSIVTNHSTEQGDEPPRMRPGDSYRRYARLHNACIDPQMPIDANAAWARTTRSRSRLSILHGATRSCCQTRGGRITGLYCRRKPGRPPRDCHQASNHNFVACTALCPSEECRDCRRSDLTPGNTSRPTRSQVNVRTGQLA